MVADARHLASFVNVPPPPLLSEARRYVAHGALRDALTAVLQSLGSGQCARWIGPMVAGATMPGGARVPGTSFELDPVHATFNLALLAHWQAECTRGDTIREPRPQDCLGGILMVCDWLARRARMQGRKPLLMRDVLAKLMLAHDFECTLAAGLDSVDRQRTVTLAVVTELLGGNATPRESALAGASRYREGGPRDCDYAVTLADAASRGVQLALLSAKQPTVQSGGEAMPIEVWPWSAKWPRAEVLGAAAAVLDLGTPLVDAIGARFPPKQAKSIIAMLSNTAELEARPVNEFVALLVAN